MPYEDFTTYTEVDSGGDITITANQCTVDTMQRAANSYVSVDKGAGNIGDYDYTVKVNISASSAGGSAFQSFGVSNAPGTIQDWDTANSGQSIMVYDSGSSYQYFLIDDNKGTSDTYSGPRSAQTVWIRIDRVSTTLRARIYSDEALTSLLDTLTLTCDTTAFRYLQCMASRDAAGTMTVTGYTANLKDNLDLSQVIEADPFILASSLSASYITPTLVAADPFLAQLLMEAGFGIGLPAPSFQIQGALSAGILVHYHILQRLMNAIRLRGPDLDLVNSIALDVTMDLGLVNDIVASLEQKLILKNTIEELVQVSKDFKLRNEIEGGVSLGEYYFDSGHDVT